MDETIVLGSGCFWCTEAVFSTINGVKSVIPGYSGGHKENPSYEEVCRGNTGHIEVAKITFDNSVITLDELLEVFFASHDPTSWDKQGADEGEQYRSVIFYMNEEQKLIAEKKIEKLEKEGVYRKKIVTEIRPLKNFYEAEDYHKKYYERNRNQPYCKFVISPKVSKIKKSFNDKIIKL